MLVLVMIEFTPTTLSWCSINTQNSVHEKSSFTSQFIVRDMTRTYSQFGSLIHQRSCFFIVSLRDLLIQIELIRKTFQLISNKIDLFNTWIDIGEAVAPLAPWLLHLCGHRSWSIDDNVIILYDMFW